MSLRDDSSYSPLALAAGKVPLGLSSSEIDSSYRGVPMTVVLGIFAGITLIVYFIRMYTRYFILRKLGWDDLTCSLGMVGALLQVVCFGIASINGPLGKHMWNITLGDFLGNNFVYPSYILQVTGSFTLGLIKLTIFLFYSGIFWPLDWCRWAIWIGASLSSAFYLCMTIVQFYFITPRPGETMAKHFGGKMADGVTKLSIPTTSVGFAIDILLLVIPLGAVFQLHIAKKKKLRLIFTFLIGIMAILGSVLSLSFKIKTYGNPDLTYHLCLVNFFISIEMIFGICIASIPLIPHAARYHRKQLSSLATNLSSALLYIGRPFSARSSTDQKSDDVYHVKGGSDSNHVERRQMELPEIKNFTTISEIQV